MKLRDVAGRFVRLPQREHKNLVNRCFGRLTVVRFAGYMSIKGGTRRLWVCHCSCNSGRRVVASTNSLTCGITTSCGCRRVEAITARNRANRGRRHEQRQTTHGTTTA